MDLKKMKEIMRVLLQIKKSKPFSLLSNGEGMMEVTRILHLPGLIYPNKNMVVFFELGVRL